MTATVVDTDAPFREEMMKAVSTLQSKLNDLEEAAPIVKVEAMLNSFEERLQKLEKSFGNTSTGPDKVTTFEIGRNSSENLMVHTKTSEEEMSLHDGEMLLYRLVPSIYDASVFLFSEVLGMWTSVYTCFLLITNVIIVFYIINVINSIAENPYDESVVDGFTWWRTNVAHSTKNVDQTNGVSLASRVCKLDQHASLESAAFQAAHVADLVEYLHNNDGFILCCLVLFVWLVLLWSEVRQAIEFFIACVSVQRAPMKLQLYRSADDVTVKMLSASFKRHVWRVGLAVYLCYGGARFILFSNVVEDLVLNAVALEFVLSIDEGFFYALAPTRAKTLITIVAPFPFPNWHKGLFGCGLPSVGGFIWVSGILALLVIGYVPGERSSRLDALQALCPFDGKSHFSSSGPISPSNWESRFRGVDEFALAVDKVGILSWAKTQTVLDIGKRSNRDKEIQFIVAAKLNGENPVTTNLSATSTFVSRFKQHLFGIGSVDYYAKNTLPEQSQLYHTHPARKPVGWNFVGCIDIRRSDGKYPEPVDSSDSWVQSIRRLAFGYMSDVYGREVTDCADIEDMCLWHPVTNTDGHQIAKAWCPGTCGCDRPDSSPMHKILYGCPSQCPFSPPYRKAVSEAPCEDTHPASPTWASWLSLIDFYGLLDLGGDSGGLAKLLSGLMKTQGCNIVKIPTLDWLCKTPENALGFAYGVFKELRYWCPVSCECHLLSGSLDCPIACNGTRISARFASTPLMRPGLPDGTRATSPLLSHSSHEVGSATTSR